MKNPRISIFVAVDKKRGIGKRNALPWYIPEDLKRFRKLTTGHVLIMGRKTFESIIKHLGKPLPNRISIIVTRDKDYSVQDYSSVYLASSLDEALEKAKDLEENEIFITGGGEVFAQAIGKVERIYLTYIDHDFDADIFFPDYSEFNKIVAEEPQKEKSEYSYKFLTLER